MNFTKSTAVVSFSLNIPALYDAWSWFISYLQSLTKSTKHSIVVNLFLGVQHWSELLLANLSGLICYASTVILVAVVLESAWASGSTCPSHRRTCWSHSALTVSCWWWCVVPPPIYELQTRIRILKGQFIRARDNSRRLIIYEPSTMNPIINSGWLRKESVNDITAVLGSKIQRHPAKNVKTIEMKRTTEISQREISQDQSLLRPACSYFSIAVLRGQGRQLLRSSVARRPLNLEGDEY